jgi:hypothetical protein
MDNNPAQGSIANAPRSTICATVAVMRNRCACSSHFVTGVIESR